MSRGPKNYEILLPPNNDDGMKNNRIPKLKGTVPESLVPRNELKLKCSHCRFEWKHETLTVRCHAEATHEQREQWVHPTWMWGLQQPHNYWKYLPATRNPRTGMLLAREQAKSHCNERRAQGLTSKTMRLERERRGISRAVSKIGVFSTRWQTRFPFPT
jgi:hypothetical protein